MINQSEFEEKHGKFSRIVEIQTLVGLSCHFERESLAHHAVERVTILSIHLFFNDLACSLNKRQKREITDECVLLGILVTQINNKNNMNYCWKIILIDGGYQEFVLKLVEREQI